MNPQNSTPIPPQPKHFPKYTTSTMDDSKPSTLQQQHQQQQAAMARFPSNIDAHLRPLGVYRPLNINPNHNAMPTPNNGNSNLNLNSNSNLSLGLGLNPVNSPSPNVTCFRPHLQKKDNQTPLQLQPQPTPVDTWRGQADAKRNFDACNRNQVVDDAFFVVRDRKVKISGSNSIYALCRSWLRNGYREESQLQPQCGEVVKTLPKPLPLAESSSLEIKEMDNDTNGEDKYAAETLSAEELLQRHINRAKKVRERLKEERMGRINRYKTRLKLLLPPPIEQGKGDTGPP